MDLIGIVFVIVGVAALAFLGKYLFKPIDNSNTKQVEAIDCKTSKDCGCK